ncbi:hypothetical protein TRFO_40089 [Tritrichomonas foetus]|uniref:Uncharacterized protein n=1 Tax=Tritrichomonas foetus TaxID=1144522 RepID=A0A1J4J630_9EUKA|nr:hypothetical protein TRFO_40089 [Tritrichomonas foetus]|eukprot:OHS93615.1 hypothetical protein TRFO_40089 [Tritrichomonas foetus]
MSFFSIFYTLSGCFLGFEIMSSLLIKSIDLHTIIAVGSIFGIILTGWITYILNLLIPLNFAFGLFQIIIYIIAGISIQFYRVKRKYLKSYSIICWFFAVLIPTLFLSWFFYYGLLYNETDTRGASFGDLPFHLNLISSFAVGCNSQRSSLFDIVSPFFAKEKLAYPIMTNFYSAILLKCFGSSYHMAIVIPSIVFGYAIFVILASLVYGFSHLQLACCIAPWLFLFTGGLGFIEYIKNPSLRNSFYTDFVHNWGNQHGSWFQTVIHILLPQRSSLHSLPTAWAIIYLLIVGAEKNKVNIRLYLAIGLLIAMLPQTQPHSIIAVAEYGVVHFILKLFPLSKEKLRTMLTNYFILAIVALVLGIPQCTPFISRTSNHNFMKIQPIWTKDKTKKFIPMWYRSLGTLFMLSLVHAPSIMNIKQLSVYLPAYFVFLISNYIWYQPWHLDNTKVFNAGWIPLVIAGVANYLAILFRTGRFGKILCMGLIISSCFSGFLAVRMAKREFYQEWPNKEIPFTIAKYVIENTPPKSIWITDEWHANPVVALAGRQTVVGYAGWIVSHGLNSNDRHTMIRNLLMNPDDSLIADKFGIEYICARSRSRDSISFHPHGSRKWKKVYEYDNYKIFKRVYPHT